MAPTSAVQWTRSRFLLVAFPYMLACGGQSAPLMVSEEPSPDPSGSSYGGSGPEPSPDPIGDGDGDSDGGTSPAESPVTDEKPDAQPSPDTAPTEPNRCSGSECPAVAVFTGYSTSCAVTGRGLVKCWGFNVGDQFHLGTTDRYQLTPATVRLDGLASNFVAVDGDNGIGPSTLSCILRNPGGVRCWGIDYDKQIAAWSSDVAAISVSHYVTCAVTTGGKAQCRGADVAP